jgi:hypothetical protein
MKINFTETDFSAATSTTLLPCICYNCNNIFYVSKKSIKFEQLNNRGRLKFCSPKCLHKYITTEQELICSNCGVSFKKQIGRINKSGNNFCSRSCSVTYNNCHKTKGIRRSKLEIYLEIELTKLYPDLEILFNNKTTINSELDIYIPSLNLAFELNGIFHYEPIHGQNKLNQIQNNDDRKFQACWERKIEFCIIDTSHQIYFKENTSIKYLKIIESLVDKKLSCNNHHVQVIQY